MADIRNDSLMGRPSVVSDGCAFCGRRPVEQHHIVYRSQGGTHGPTITVCGFGNAGGCHALLHAHKLHLRWSEDEACWEWLRTEDSVREEEALRMDGWRELKPGKRVFYVDRGAR